MGVIPRRRGPGRRDARRLRTQAGHVPSRVLPAARAVSADRSSARPPGPIPGDVLPLMGRYPASSGEGRVGWRIYIGSGLPDSNAVRSQSSCESHRENPQRNLPRGRIRWPTPSVTTPPGDDAGHVVRPHEPAVLDLQDDVVRGDEAAVVGHDHQGLRPVAQEADDLLAAGAVEVTGRLVGEDQLRIVDRAPAPPPRAAAARPRAGGAGG